MNRHERRRALRLERDKGARKEKAREGQPFPPGYYDLVKQMARLIPEWIRAQPKPPDLRWLERGDTIFAGSLGAVQVQKYLADSPDAFRLLAWLDEQTGREGTLFQADCALRHLGLLGPERGKRAVEAYEGQPGMQSLMAFAFKAGTDTDLGDGSPCGHCGKVLLHATGQQGHQPQPGSFALCMECLGWNRFDDQLRHVAISEEEFAQLPPDAQADFTTTRDFMRQARMRAWAGKSSSKVEA